MPVTPETHRIGITDQDATTWSEIPEMQVTMPDKNNSDRSNPSITVVTSTTICFAHAPLACK